MYRQPPRTKLNYNFNAKLQPYSVRVIIDVIVVNCVFQQFQRRIIFRQPMFLLRKKGGNSGRWRVFVSEKRYQADPRFELFVPCKWPGILWIELLPREIPLTYLRWRHWRRRTYCRFSRFLADYVFILCIFLFYTFFFFGISKRLRFTSRAICEHAVIALHCVYPHVNLPKYENPYQSLSLGTDWREILSRFFLLALHPIWHVYNR